MEHREVPGNGNEPIAPAAPLPKPTQKHRLTQAKDFLVDNNRVYLSTSRYSKYRRYVVLKRNEMYASLVSAYEQMFIITWPKFRRFMEGFGLPQGTNLQQHAARVYISTWLVDLYVSNREAVMKLSSIAFSERYQHELVHCLYEYDEFLVLLNASIRPTPISYTTESTLYIPLIVEEYNWTGDNPFNITNFVYSPDIVLGLMEIMKTSKKWSITTLSDSTIGRPCWLFDWHSDQRVCSWFHPESNYNEEDVTLAYIVGVACTPNLGPVDIDDWQAFPGGTLPSNPNYGAANRVSQRRFFGSYEVRTYQAGTYVEPETLAGQVGAKRSQPSQSKKAKTTSTGGQLTVTGTEPSASGGPHTDPQDEEMSVPLTYAQFRILDWCYNHRVIQQIEDHTRTGALRKLCFLA